MRDAKITDTGCYLDNHRGHYIQRDVIELAEGWGFIMGPFEKFAVSVYDSATDFGDETYPYEGISELCDEAIAWLNSGQGECGDCDGTGKGIPGRNYYYTHKDHPDVKLCKKCSGTGRGDRIEFQNFPPRVPEGFTWDWNDGDFGLYNTDDEGEVA